VPDPKTARHPVLRLPLRDWSSVWDADHPDREFESHQDDYIEFEIVQWRDTKGISGARRVLRGVGAM
jgi:hypothetical protein